MKVSIEFDKKKNHGAEIYRQVLSKKAKAVQIIGNTDDTVSVELWFDDSEFFEQIVNLIVGIDFKKVCMINNQEDDEEPTDSDEDAGGEENDENQVSMFDEGFNPGGDVPVLGIVPKENDALEDGGIIPQGGVIPEEGKKPEQRVVVQGVFKEGEVPAEVIPQEKPKLEGEGEKVGGNKPEETLKPPPDKKEKKAAGNGTGKGSRKREGKELKNLFDVPDFPDEITLESVMEFLGPMKDTVIEPVRQVITIAIDPSRECNMEWKDLVAVAAKAGVHLSDFDKVKYSKQIADALEKRGFSVRAKGFLKLLRDHVSGVMPKRRVVPVIVEAAAKPAPVVVPVKQKVSRFAMIPYHEELEELFSRLWDEGQGLEEILIEIFAFMGGEELTEDECAYLKVCAECIAFDSLNDVYLDLNKSQTEARGIQASLSEKLMDFVDKNNFKDVKLYDFICDIRDIFEREA